MLDKLLTILDAGVARRSTLQTYYDGTQPLAFLAPEAKQAIGNRFARVATKTSPGWPSPPCRNGCA